MFVGPILTDSHRTRAAEQISHDLLLRAGYLPLSDPATWVFVAQHLNVKCEAYDGLPNGSRGRLVYSTRRDQWVIEYNNSFTEKEQSEALIHELAHWFQRLAEPEWLCGEMIVYYYEGPVDDERHKIARWVERLVLG